jgi:DNA-binding CsgD family transcriptional regulator
MGGQLAPVRSRAVGAMEVTSPAAGLIGRDNDVQLIDRLLEGARRGQSGSLVIRGEPGIGKTALLERAREQADDMVVLRAAGVDPESDLAFAGLFGLLRPVLGRIKDLVQPQSDALAGALGLAPSSGSDRFLVSAAVLSLLAAVAEDQPVLCLVDDAQWLDLPSAEALTFAARRLDAEPVVILFAAREGESGQFDGSGLPELAITGIDELSARRILASVAEEAAGAVCERLVREAAGNPLALLELPTGLSEAQLAGREPMPDAIPLTSRLAGVFRQRFDQLPQATQAALVVAAADDTGELSTVLRATSQLDLGGDALDPAERSGLVRTINDQLRFRHPLARSAIYDAAPLGARRRALAALASALSGEEHADRRVWHQALASTAGDEEVASALETAATRAGLRAAHASAATAFERAAALTLEAAPRARRLASAATAALDAGQGSRARGLVEAAMPIAGPALRAKLLHVRGMVEARAGNPRDALHYLVEGADGCEDVSLSMEMLREATMAAIDAGEHAVVATLDERAARLSAPNNRDKFNQTTIAALAALVAGDHRRARTCLANTLRLSAELDDPSVQLWAVHAARLGLDLGAGLPYATRAVELARRQGLLSLLAAALDQQAAELFLHSKFDLAYAAAEEGYRLSLDLGQGPGGNLEVMARVEAVRGNEPAAREYIDQLLALGEAGGNAWLSAIARAALGTLELTLGRPDRAASALLDVIADEPSKHIAIGIIRVVLLDAVEAVVRASQDPDPVNAALSRYRDWVAAAPSDARTALLALCEAMISRRSPEPAFLKALELAHALPPFQRARAELLYGEWLRRQRRRTDARVHLRAATDLFRTVGVEPWAHRAEAELRAAGETARKRDPSTIDDLTAQERQIAGLVAEGLSNREIAAQMFISPRTVEYHLGKVFSKLNITSRNQLIRQGIPRPDVA